MSLEAFICFHHVSLLIIDILPMVWRSASALKAIDDSSESVQSKARGNAALRFGNPFAKLRGAVSLSTSQRGP